MPTCALVVHHAGGLTGLTATLSHVPQLLLPQEAKVRESSRLVGVYGCGISLLPDEATEDRVADALEELLHKPSYAERAGDLAREIDGIAGAGRGPRPRDLPGVNPGRAAVRPFSAGPFPVRPLHEPTAS